ncbi:hypothetical protein GPAL_1581 [Glaciecola pallidula DSM 14239 = ACAM 615]|uniref:Uncharacterized protein n=1 Tax=Brumicola pallidula DSM 14239 = ACAM 615 TaxID=1121922 RepID=K6ZYS2_9ALTE|nr:hypothetical protein GPAL_1581 [Glaciecola pallidula DSM 14239 = ACAM 615]
MFFCVFFMFVCGKRKANAKNSDSLICGSISKFQLYDS